MFGASSQLLPREPGSQLVAVTMAAQQIHFPVDALQKPCVVSNSTVVELCSGF
jgi:hypothetical protein